MRNILLISLFLAAGYNVRCQKLYLAPGIGAQFTSLSYFPAGGNPYDDMSMPKFQFVPTVGIGLNFKTKRFTHRLSAQYMAFGMGFKYRTYSTLLKANKSRFDLTTSLDHALIAYSIRKTFGDTRRLPRSEIHFHASMGVGVGTNRSQAYFDQFYFYDSFQKTTSVGDYAWWEYYPKREGLGVFLMPEVGLTFRNRKKQRDFLTLDLFYYKGLRNMVSYDLRYGHGNPNDNVAIQRQVLAKTRGTVFGLKLSVPIQILAEKW